MELARDARLLLLGRPPRFLFALPLESLRLRLELRGVRAPRPHVVAEDPGGGQRNHPRCGKQHVVVEPQNGSGERDDGRGRCAQGGPPRPVRRNRVDGERRCDRNPVAEDEDPADRRGHDHGEDQHRIEPSRKDGPCLGERENDAQRDVVMVVDGRTDVPGEQGRRQHRVDEKGAPPEPVPDHEKTVLRRRVELRVAGGGTPGANRKRYRRPQREHDDRSGE